jgi:antirestriction protein ArdC|tara:strand:- start:794 stop:1666 length:873 start_codon:yes stop_codon:yes gene_type:complete
MENKIYEKITQDFFDTVSEHGTDWKKQWVGDSEMPINMVSKKNYSGINFLILSFQKMTSPFWGTLKQFKDADLRIKSDEFTNWTEIVFYKMIESKNKTDEEGNPLRFPLLKTYRVWNMSQTVGYVEPVKEEVKTFSHNDAENWVSKTGAKIFHTGAVACYRPTQDEILMPPKESFVNTQDSTASQGYYGTLFHELTHWTGHETRCNRKLRSGFGSEDYAFEELIAELGACFQSVKFGIEQQEVNADHKKYIASWLKTLKNDKKFIFKASAQANKSVNFLESLQEGEKKVA